MITRKFSSVATEKRTDGGLEVCYELGDGDAIRAVMSLGGGPGVPAAGSPPGAQAPDEARLQGLGVTSLSCPDPDCSRGPPPLKQASAPDQIQFWIALPAGASLQMMEGGQSCLIVRGRKMAVAIPVFDGSLASEEALSGALKPYRKWLEDHHCMELECVDFHVYLIAEAPDPLAELRGKRIALAIPSGCVKAAAGAEVAVATDTRVAAGDDERADNDEVAARAADEQISALA